MKKFARVNNGKVVNVVNCVDEATLHIIFKEYNQANPGKWVEYTPSTKNKPSVGFGYEKTTGVFYKPIEKFPSWTLNKTTGKNEPPVTQPSDGKNYDWDEANKAWKLALGES